MKDARDSTKPAVGIGSDFERSVFIMMRYGSEASGAIEQAIRSSLAHNGLVPHLAKDRSIVDSLWENVRTYMDNCKYGIAVFEDIDVREFNPNVSLELGYMMGQEKRCLVLKEQRMPRLPTDIVGHIYRSFDVFSSAASISREVTAWIHDDLALDQPDEVARVFMDHSREGQRLQKILMFLSSANQPIGPSEIERNLCVHVGDTTTDVCRLIERLRLLELIEFVDNQGTLGSYELPKEIRRRILQLLGTPRETTDQRDEPNHD